MESQRYRQAVDEESHLRDIAYLGQPEIVCGVPLKQLTPYLWAVLRALRTPFLYGGTFDHRHVAQLLCALAVEPPKATKSLFQRETGQDAFVRRLALTIPLEECERDIRDYFDTAFMDAPDMGSGKASTPIASPVAWLVYRFTCEPFRKSEADILHKPLRVLYQEMRCWQREHGESIINKSHKLKGDAMDVLQAALEAGEITTEDIDQGRIPQHVFDRMEGGKNGEE